MYKQLLIFNVIFLMVLLSNCAKQEVPDPMEPEEPLSTWEVIQTQIFEPNCVACHTAGTTFAKESDLILTADVGYKQLVGRSPHNVAAIEDGLELVGVEGVASLERSFLWEKINTPAYQHFYADHPDYGSLMPLGSKSLTNGELEFIRKWINEGAPETGIVADEALLDDDSRFEIADDEFAPLDLPESGFQIHIEPFPIFKNNEREFFYYWPLENEEAIYANRFEVSMANGSHHLLFYKNLPGEPEPEPYVFRDFRDENGNENYETLFSIGKHIFVWGTQIPRTDYSLPEGMALEIEPGQGFDLNAHYVNYSDEEYNGEIYANVHTVDKSDVDIIVRNMFLNNTNFSLPPGQETTIKKSYTFDEPRQILNFWSHAHKRMTEFRVYISGGGQERELVYYTNDWEHPPLTEYSPPLRLMPNQTLEVEATYFNESEFTKSFGLLSEDEMMILFGMYF